MTDAQSDQESATKPISSDASTAATLLPAASGSRTTSDLIAPSSAGGITQSSDIALEPTSTATLPLLSSSPVVTPTSSSSSVSSLADTSGQNTDWGPAITAPPLSTSGSTAYGETSTQQSQITPDNSGASFTKGQQNAIIVPTIIGGIFVIALLVYGLYRRRKGASLSEIVHFRSHAPSTIVLSPEPQNMHLTALPIYYETRYSVRSSKHFSQMNLAKPSMQTASVPPSVRKRFQQNPAAANVGKATNLESDPSAIQEEPTSFLDDVRPTSSKVDLPQVREPEMARTAATRPDSRSHVIRHRSDGPVDKPISISVRSSSPDEANSASRPLSPGSHQELNARWSWTNSSAPPTPRYAPGLRSSISSFTRFRGVKGWTRFQSESIEEEQLQIQQRPMATSATTRRLVLKNQAAKPNLAPPSRPATARSR